MSVVVPVFTPASPGQRVRLTLHSGGVIYAEATDVIRVERMAVRIGSDAWIGFVRPCTKGQAKITTQYGAAQFDLADVQLLRLLDEED
jgi:hypothetical protein